MNINLDDVKAVALAAGKVGAPVIEQILLSIATVEVPVFGPGILNIIFPMINTALGLDPDTDPSTTAQKIEDNPDQAKEQLTTLTGDQQFQLALTKQVQDNTLASQAQQVSLNTIEEQNPSWFVAGWRPLIGWSLGGVLVASSILPYIVWLLLQLGVALTPPPEMSTTSLSFLAGILGLTIAAKSVDKAVGTSPKAIGGNTTTITRKVVK